MGKYNGWWESGVCCTAAGGMELRRRKGEAQAAANAKNAPTIDAERLSNQHQSQTQTHDDIGATAPLSSKDEADAVVGAAVRGGSLLMLLALIQVPTAE